ncbi:MAG: acyl-CoA synthetase [Gammaproteobacteria bacterium]|nr:MAG: acyl-CoA synthetase [Gammaproteobacteria bacterium]
MINSYASVWETVSEIVPDRPAIIHGDTTRTWREFEHRASRLANAFVTAGLKADSKIGHYLYNCNEYIETHFAAFKMRASPINVNYRYLEEELIYLLDNSDCEAVIFHGRLAERINSVKDKLPKLKLLIQVQDDTEAPLINGAVEFEAFLAGAQPLPRIEYSEDDVYMLYTGGTTGMPKGVMYRHGDHTKGMSLSYDFRGLKKPRSKEELKQAILALEAKEALPVNLAACPLMHGTGIWLGGFCPLMAGGCAVTLPNIHFDAHGLLKEVTRHKVTDLIIVGDAFAKPITKALDEALAAGEPHDISSLSMVISSGVMWTTEIKQRMLKHHDMMLVDAMGSTEGSMGRSFTSRKSISKTAKFEKSQHAKVFNEQDQEVTPGSGEIGIIAAGGMVPLGYYKDPEKSAKTFRTIDGVRYSFPGDFATVEADGSIKLLGRGSACINSGGEKIFPEEVEEAVKRHPNVYDCLVVGVPDERFGQKVIAVASPLEGQTLIQKELILEARKHVAGYKLPKHVVIVPQVKRAPNGKANYKWAKQIALDAFPPEPDTSSTRSENTASPEPATEES